MSKDYSLSLRGEAFNSLCADFDTTLRDVLAGMIETEQNTGEINIIFVGVTWLCTELFCEWNEPPYGRSGFQCSSVKPKPFAIVYYAENKKRLVPMDSVEKVER